MKIKVIMPVGDIPLGTTVTKLTGKKEYLIRDEFRIYEDDSNYAVTAKSGTRFMVSDDGNVECVPADYEALWHVDAETLMNYLDDMLTEDK